MTSVDVDVSMWQGREFISTIEGKEMPVYATQYHPERPQFDWAMEFPRPGSAHDHTADVVEAMQYLARFCESSI